MWSSALKSFQSNINSNYKVSEAPTTSSGPWRIFEAKNKSTGKAASVFVFDKKVLEQQSGGLGGRTGATALKKAQDDVVERLRREASSLARLRHPSILELVEPVEDTRSGGLQFATEPVTVSLSGLLRDKDGEERSGGVGGRRSRHVVDDPEHGGKKRRNVDVDELETQKGLLQVGKGLEFLHESAGLVHGNLTPDAIFVNAKGDWKIAGLGFSGKSEGTTAATSAPAITLHEVLNFDPRLPRFVQIDLDYSSPDFIMDGNASSAADMFSLGLLIIAIYNSPHQSPLETNMSISSYKRIFTSSSSVPSQSNNFLSSVALPRPVSNLLPRLITRRPAQRMSAREFQQAEYFDSILMSTIRFLESLPAKTANEKSQFLRGLPKIINQFPKAVLEKKVLPALLDEMKDRELIGLILQNVFKIIQAMSTGRRVFGEKVIPKLREVFLAGNTKKDAAPERDSTREAGLMIILGNMSIITENTNGKEFKDDIWPIIQISMESSTHSLVDAALGTLSDILSILDFSSVKNEVFPVIAAVFSKTSSLGIKIRGLEAFQILCGGVPGGGDSSADDDFDGLDPQEKNKKKQQSVILDKYTIQEKVVPIMKAIKTKEPAVMMATLDVFREVGKIADSDFLAMEVLPVLWSMSLGPLLNLQQFQSFMALIKSLSSRIETEQVRKLQELSSANSTAANRADFMSSLAPQGSNALDDSNGDSADFESLVLGRNKPSSSGLDSALDAWSQPQSANARPSGSRTSTNASPAATFSWSTPPTLNSTTLQPSRTVTPDQNLNAFASLQPSAPSTSSPSYSATLQPMQVSSPMQPSPGGVNWSMASNSSANAWGSSNPSSFTSPSPMQPINNAWSSNMSLSQPIQPMRPSSNPSFPQQAGTFTIPAPPTSPYSNFNIAPPPTGSATRPQQSFGGMGGMQSGGANGMTNRSQTQQPAGQKQGLDKYESLI